MNKNKINNVIEYLSATMIFSYFFVHNIFFVIIGISFSFYLLNIDFINSVIRPINRNFIIKISTIVLNKNDKLTKANSINIDSNKDDKKLSLVETIEELGIIPSIDKNEESDAA